MCAYIYALIVLIKGIVIKFLKPIKYSILVALLILVELGCAAFIFFDKNWKEVSKFVCGNMRSKIN